LPVRHLAVPQSQESAGDPPEFKGTTAPNGMAGKAPQNLRHRQIANATCPPAPAAITAFFWSASACRRSRPRFRDLQHIRMPANAGIKPRVETPPAPPTTTATRTGCAPCRRLKLHTTSAPTASSKKAPTIPGAPSPPALLFRYDLVPRFISASHAVARPGPLTITRWSRTAATSWIRPPGGSNIESNANVVSGRSPGRALKKKNKKKKKKFHILPPTPTWVRTALSMSPQTPD